MSKKTILLLGVALLLAVGGLLFAGGGKEKAEDYPTKSMEFIAPGGAGGGWDLTIRTVARVLGETKLVKVAMPITNKPGGGGGITLAYLQEKKGSDKIICVYSPPLLFINLNGSTPYSYKNTTPLARLISDYGAFAVAKKSPYTSIAQVMEALKKDPASVTIGGNSSVGSMDHVQFLLIAKAAGVKDLKKIQYISFQDNSGAAQLLGGHIDLLSTGLGEVRGLLESGDLRSLASTAPHRVGTGVIHDIPTCKEQGIDATFVNWRGLFGAPDMPKYAQDFWRKVLAQMVKTPQWDAVCAQNGWDKSYMDGPEFSAFLGKVNVQYEEIFKEIGIIK